MESRRDQSSGEQAPPSLGERIVVRAGERWRALRGPPMAWSGVRQWLGDEPLIPIALTLLIASAPLSVWIGARWQEGVAQARTAQLNLRLKPRENAVTGHQAARQRLAHLLDRPRLVALTDQLVQILPEEARIVRLSREENGATRVDIMTNDPAALRAAFRGDSRFSGWRTRSERRVDSGMIVTMSEQGA